MNYFKVLVTTGKYHGSDSLTYSSENDYAVGQIVIVPIRGNKSPAIIIAKTSIPPFNTKPILSLLVTKALPKTSLELLDWIQSYYPTSSSTAASLFIPNNLFVKKTNDLENDSSQKVFGEESSLPRLTHEQQQVIQGITTSKSKTFLLHGDTGTGKTRVYVELILRTLSLGKSCIILTPEISLTPQLMNMVQAHVPAEVIVIHSNLSQKDRRNIWLKILHATRPIVVIGPRSALFVPVNNLGLIVIDEFHDTAYKQDQSPHYSAIRVASALASTCNALLVFGSATPPVSEYFYAEMKHVPVLRMTSLAKNEHNKTTFHIINSRDKSNFTKNYFLSNELLDAIAINIQKKEQTLLFLNRRGTARLILCQSCDWQALCIRCDLPLTYHGDSHSMQCHTCGYRQKSVTICPVCRSTEILFKSIGTKAVESHIKSLFPEAKVRRFDTDNTKEESLEKQFNTVANGEVDVIIGTQLLVKGLDLPRLSLVGIIAADSSLYFPDFSSEEQSYQLLKQVIGRVSRGHRDGTVFIQTINPEGITQKAAIENNWEKFYNEQLTERQKYLFPPYCFMLKLTCSRKSQRSAENAALKLKAHIESLPLQAQVVGPAPRFNEKVRGLFNWQLIIKSKRRTDLIKIIKSLPSNWNYDIDPINLL